MKTILVVDDDITMVRMHQLHLERAGYAVYSFETGAEVLRALRDEGIRPDLAVFDYDLPDMKGIELIAAFHGTEGLQDRPVIMVTGQAKSHIQQQLVEAGALKVFSKPFSPSRLVRVISQLLEASP